MAVDITVGMVFERDGASHLRWVVEAVRLIDGIPHVYVRSLGDRTDVRLLATAVLADRREFRHAGTIADPG